MDIRKILICDDVSESVVEGLKAANLTVDCSFDISAQKLLEVIQVCRSAQNYSYFLSTAL